MIRFTLLNLFPNMKNKIFHFLLPMLACLTLILGCFRKEPNVGVGGYVREFGTDKPIPNARVYAIDCQGELLGSIQCFRADSTRTDDNGAYFMPKQPEWISATASNYWESEHLAPVLYQKELETNVSLYPFAWLKVMIRNESGAYGFYPPQDGSGYPPIRLEQGRDTTLPLDLSAGNKITKYLFSVRVEENGSFPGPDYWQQVKAIVNGDPTEIQVGIGAFLDFYLTGHDTTNLTIIY